MKILWIPHAGWHIPQRAHLFCRELADRHEVHVTNWIADFNSVNDYLSKRYLENYSYSKQKDGKVVVHRIPRISPALYSPILRKLNSFILSIFVQRLIEIYKYDVIIGSYLISPPNHPNLIFDVFDDNPAYWQIYRNNHSYSLEIRKNEQRNISKSNFVVVVSSVLRDTVAKLKNSKKIFFIPNGINLDKYRRADGIEIRKFYGLDKFKVIGLISSLGEFTGLTKLIRCYSQLNDNKLALLIVGDGPHLELARRYAVNNRLSNVIFTGKIPYEEIPRYFKAIDIGVIPFDKNEFTDAACPIKLLEYSAAGKIVVSTNLTEISRMSFPNVILVEQTPEALTDGLRMSSHIEFQQPETINEYDIRLLAARYESLLSGASG